MGSAVDLPGRSIGVVRTVRIVSPQLVAGVAESLADVVARVADLVLGVGAVDPRQASFVFSSPSR